jgi:RimJ/RimL family protein N-acetyltransferase
MSDPAPPVVNIEGRLVALGPQCRKHLPLYWRWINDFGTTRTLGVPMQPMTLEQEIAWYEQTGTGESRYAFTIYERASWRAIGNCELVNVNMQHRRAEVGIMFGEPAMRGRGYGTEAVQLLLDYAFTVLGLHSVMLRVYAYNHAARRCYEKAGFRETGRRRESRWFNGQFWDEISMDILDTEFESRVLKETLDPGEKIS